MFLFHIKNQIKLTPGVLYYTGVTVKDIVAYPRYVYLCISFY